MQTAINDSGMSYGGQIIELSEGFTLEFRGRTYACETAESLGAKITELARAPKVATVPPVVPFPGRFTDPTPDPSTAPDGQWEYDPRQGWQEPVPDFTVPTLVSLDLQQENLTRLADSFVAGRINGDQWEKYLPRACPDMSPDMVDAALHNAQLQAFGPPGDPEGFAPELSDEGSGLEPVTGPQAMPDIDDPSTWGHPDDPWPIAPGLSPEEAGAG